MRAIRPIPTRRVSEGPIYLVSATSAVGPSLTRRVMMASVAMRHYIAHDRCLSEPLT
jgi:hypothetical protein